MAFFNKTKDVAISDNCFLGITWEPKQSPKDLPALLQLIEGIDQEILVQQPTMLADTLPYLTFIQAEVLFSQIRDTFGAFQLEKLAVCRKENGEVVSQGEVFASPFMIDSGYQNLLDPLMKSILTDEAFSSYSYAEKRDYFTDDIFPAYQASLGIATSSLPVFPEQGETQRETTPQTAPQEPQATAPAHPALAYAPPPSKWQKVAPFMAGGIAVLALGLGVLTLSLQNKTAQINYLHEEVTRLEDLQANQPKIDVFVRYFLPSLYSGNKDNLKAFVNAGNAKYTKAETGTLQSVIQESITKDNNLYHATYVLVVKGDGEAQSKRIEMTLKADKKAQYGYLLTEEPVISNSK